jgi:hypothetical protein
MAKKKIVRRKSKAARKGCIPASVAKRGKRLKKGYKYKKGGCIVRAKHK